MHNGMKTRAKLAKWGVCKEFTFLLCDVALQNYWTSILLMPILIYVLGRNSRVAKYKDTELRDSWNLEGNNKICSGKSEYSG